MPPHQARDRSRLDLKAIRPLLTHGFPRQLVEPLDSLLHYGFLQEDLIMQQKSSKLRKIGPMSSIKMSIQSLLEVEDEPYRQHEPYQRWTLNPSRPKFYLYRFCFISLHWWGSFSK